MDARLDVTAGLVVMAVLAVLAVLAASRHRALEHWSVGGAAGGGLRAVDGIANAEVNAAIKAAQQADLAAFKKVPAVPAKPAQPAVPAKPAQPAVPAKPALAPIPENSLGMKLSEAQVRAIPDPTANAAMNAIKQGSGKLDAKALDQLAGSFKQVKQMDTRIMIQIQNAVGQTKAGLAAMKEWCKKTGMNLAGGPKGEKLRETLKKYGAGALAVGSAAFVGYMIYSAVTEEDGQANSDQNGLGDALQSLGLANPVACVASSGACLICCVCVCCVSAAVMMSGGASKSS